MNDPLFLNLPTDYMRSTANLSTYCSFNIQFTSTISKKLRLFATSESTTPFIILLATFKILLFRYTGKNNLLLGCSISSLSSLKSENQWCALEHHDIGQQTFTSFLVGLCKLIQAITEQMKYSVKAPVFHAGIGLRTISKNHELTMDAVHYWQKITEHVTSPMDLNLLISDDEQLSLSFIYCSELFKPSTISRLADHFMVLLGAINSNPMQCISQLPLLTEIEKNKILMDWNDNQVIYPQDKCVHQLFETQTKDTPDAVAIVFANEVLTYQSLNIRANQLAHFLTKRGITSGDFVGLCLERSIAMVIAILAVVKTGATYIPIDPTYPQVRLSFILQDCQASLLLTERKFVTHWRMDFIPSVLCLEENKEEISQESQKNLLISIDLSDLVYLIYTSGSTGQPKGVMIPHKGLLNLVFWHQNVFHVTSQDRSSQLANVAFDACQWELWPYLTIGAQIHLAPAEVVVSPHDLQDWLVNNQISIAFLPTPLAESILSLKWSTVAKLRMMLIGGDKLHNTNLEHCPFQLVNNYGPTENSVVTTSSLVNSGSIKDPSIGRPIDNHLCYILDTALQPVPIGVEGELYVGGIGLAKGYLNRPKLTQEKFIKNPFAEGSIYKSGDLVRYRNDGHIEFIGRIDHQVKIRGYRIELGEIETLLFQHVDVKEVVVLAREDIPNDKYLAAYVVLHKAKAISEADLFHYAGSKLPDYMLPKAWLIVASLPLSPHGKVDRQALPIPEKNRSLSRHEYIQPRTEIEKILAHVLQQALQLKTIGVYDNFQDMGANSLLLSKIYHQLKVDLEPHLVLLDLYKYPTISALARYLSSLTQPHSEKYKPEKKLSRGIRRSNQLLAQKGRRRQKHSE